MNASRYPPGIISKPDLNNVREGSLPPRLNYRKEVIKSGNENHIDTITKLKNLKISEIDQLLLECDVCFLRDQRVPSDQSSPDDTSATSEEEEDEEEDDDSVEKLACMQYEYMDPISGIESWADRSEQERRCPSPLLSDMVFGANEGGVAYREYSPMGIDVRYERELEILKDQLALQSESFTDVDFISTDSLSSLRSMNESPVYRFNSMLRDHTMTYLRETSSPHIPVEVRATGVRTAIGNGSPSRTVSRSTSFTDTESDALGSFEERYMNGLDLDVNVL